MRNCILVTVLCILFFSLAKSQDSVDYPVIGKPCPDFTLNEVHQFNKSRTSLKDFRGKPFILDFFEQHCSICFNSFPKIDRLQRQFGDSVQVILVGLDQPGVREVYGKFQKHFGFELPVAYDSQTFKRFHINQYPFLVWVDDRGIVQATTSSFELQEEYIRRFVSHQSIAALPQEQSEHKGPLDKYFDSEKPLLMNGNGGDDMDFVYRSVLMKWRNKQEVQYDANLSSSNIGMVQGAGMTVWQLYRDAFGDTLNFLWPSFDGVSPNHYGDWFLQPVIRTKDSLVFQYDFTTGKNLFTYSLLVPGARSINEMQKKMQSDLNSYFGFDVSVEKRKMPYWKLIASAYAKSKLLTKGRLEQENYDFTHLTISNQPVRKLIVMLWSFNQDQVFIDEAGISSNIDISLNAIMTDFNDVRKALNKYGLDLVKGTKEMKTIVFRDSPPE